MGDKKLFAILLGATIGTVAIIAAVNHFRHHRSKETVVMDVNDIVLQAKETVKKLDQAVESLRRSTI